MCFSPLTGITQLETFAKYNISCVIGCQFQSPYGDYLVRNITFVTNVIKIIGRFQSPYGDYLVRNLDCLHLVYKCLQVCFSPLTGITQLETWLRRSLSIKKLSFSPLTGITQLETGLSFLPVVNGTSFSPLTGITQLETRGKVTPKS